MRYWIAALALLALAACQPKPTVNYRTGAVLLDEPFDQSFAWESYENAGMGANLRVENGAYHMTVSGGGYIWGLNAQPHGDVVFTAQSAQLSDFNNNAYGMMCRADPNNDGDGYYFLISGDGYWSIRRGRGGRIEALIEFERTDAVVQGRGINSIRVLCIEDYLALYVNDYFVGEARDDLYTRGYAGFVIAAAEEGEAEVTFDAARIVEGTLVK